MKNEALRLWKLVAQSWYTTSFDKKVNELAHVEEERPLFGKEYDVLENLCRKALITAEDARDMYLAKNKSVDGLGDNIRYLQSALNLIRKEGPAGVQQLRSLGLFPQYAGVASVMIEPTTFK